MSSRESEVQISVYASKLKNVAGFGKGTSDPYCVVTLLAGSDDERAHILGRTEVIKNDLSPGWTTTFATKYCFGKETRINLGVFDDGRKSKGNRSMGSAQFEIGEILGAKGNVKAKRLKLGGIIFLRVTKASQKGLGTLKLSLKGIKLKNMDGMFGKSDPFFTLETQIKGDHGGRQWQPVYRSEHVMNNLNPVWKECVIPVDKLCGGDKEMPLQISIYDWEKNGKHQTMGKCQTSTNGLLSAGCAGTYFELIRKGKSYGKVLIAKAIIEGQQMDPNSPPSKFAYIEGVRQVNPDYKKWQKMFGRQSISEQFQPPAEPQSPAKPKSPPRRSSDKRHGHSRKRHSRGESGHKRHSHSRSSHDRTLESSPTTSSNYSEPPLPPAMSPPPLMPPSLDSLSLEPTTARTEDENPRFVDYLSGGTEINLSVAIDFTGSNGDPRKPGTLHYVHKDGQLNDYEKAITAVASIVARYDSDQMFPVYGFGAKFDGVINHCFQVGKSTELEGIVGVIKGYRNVFKKGITMSGPTVFADVIMQAGVQAQSKQEYQRAQGKQSYSILLILTDGDVADVELTKQAIQYASSAPLSIVIVGVGNEDFSRMQLLDDFHRHHDSVRDIVQFVEFKKHRDNKQRLTQETLDEIPDQLVDYFLGQGIQPSLPVQEKEITIQIDNHSSMTDLDLDIVEGRDGDLELRNSSIARYDTRSYGDTSHFLSESTGPPSTQASSAPGSSKPSHRSSGNGNPSSAPPSSYSGSGQYNPGGIPQGSPRSRSPMPSNRSKGSKSYNSSSASGYTSSHSEAPPVMATQPATAASGRSVAIQVKAPPNSFPGMQIRVAHPQTGQLHVVAIPVGVYSGGEFRVNL